MERNKNGTFIKGHIGWNKGNGWSNEERICKCGKVFNPRKKLQKSCSQHCAMVGQSRRLGSKMSLETREKIKHTWFKKGLSPWNKNTKGIVNGYWKDKKRLDVSGSNHFLWKGGITPTNEKIRKSLEYQIWRRKIYKRDNWTCQNCGIKFIKNKTGRVKLQVHHIKSFSLYPELRTDINNGITLCKDCHKKTDNYGYKK